MRRIGGIIVSLWTESLDNSARSIQSFSDGLVKFVRRNEDEELAADLARRVAVRLARRHSAVLMSRWHAFMDGLA